MTRVRRTFAITLAVALTTALGSSLASAGAADQGDPEAIEGDYLGVSPAVRDLAPADPSASSGPVTARSNPDPLARGTSTGDGGPDPLLADGRRANGRTPTPGLVFGGTGNPAACGGCTPPDTTGDVGPNHYIQMVNATKVQIFNKAGVSLAGPFNLSTLFPAGNCGGANNDGDPQVLYDPLADRWLLSQFQNVGGGTPFHLCFAISQTADPLGAYFTYDFSTPEFPDYFKVGVWPTGYYVSTNESSYAAYAFNRTAMLAGAPATGIRFPGETNFLMPADVDGPNAPAPQGGLFYTFKDNTFHGGADRLEVFQLTPDFATPASSTFTNIATIPIASFTYTVCGFFVLDCIPQPGTAEGLDPVSEWPMQRLVYRRLAGHETLLGNFTVDVGSDRAGIRWFELRNTGGGYTLFQEGTHAPADGLHRWMGSIAMDNEGNIALGYSVSSGAVFPSIRYATRVPADPLGTLQAEQTLQAGAGSQTSTANRWGDYSAMSVDPTDDCTFWYTNEYYTATSTSTWSTRIGNFKEPTCPLPKTLTVATDGTGSGFVDSAPAGIDCGRNTPGTHTDCTQSYTNGTLVTLTAHPDANTDFAGFTGDCTDAGPTCTTTMDAAKSVTATFTLKQRPLTVVTAGTGSGFVDSAPAGIDCGRNTPGTHTDCSESYADGTSVTLTAHPDANTDFAGFTGDCTDAGPTCTTTMDAAKSVTATFTLNPSSEFTIGKVKRNTKNGTAKMTVTVPGPGELALTGKGVKPQRPTRGRHRLATKPVTGAGAVTLKIKPTGKTKKKLNKKGKAKVKVTVTYTPTGGTAASTSQKVKLKKKRR